MTAFRERDVRKGKWYYRGKIVLLIILFCCIDLTHVSAQNIVFNHLKVENGLSHKSVFAIVQDSRGFMWFGTRHGLNRYDGRSFRIYEHDDADSSSISSSYVSSLVSDTAGSVWVGTEAGLDRYDPVRDCFIKTPVTAGVTALLMDNDGTVWAATAKGVYRLKDKQHNRFTPVNIGDGLVRCMFADHEGIIWIGTTCGLIRLKKHAGGYCKEVFLHDDNNTASLSDNGITTVAEDKYRRLWVGTQCSGVNRYDPASHSFVRYEQQRGNTTGIINNNIRKIFSDRLGRLWICTQEGLSIMDPLSGRCISFQHDPVNRKSLSQNSLHSIFQDNNGSIWIGTYFGGVNVVHSSVTAFSIWQNNEQHGSISNNVVSGMAEDGAGNLWIGTEGGGLNYFSRATGNFTAYKHQENDPSSIGSNLVKTVLKDKDGNIWVGTHSGGINLLDPATGRFKHFAGMGTAEELFNTEVGALMEDSQGRFWSGWQNGVIVYRRRNRNLEQLPLRIPELQNRHTTCFLEDRKKNIWIGTAEGLYLYADGRCKLIQKNGINCIREDARGRIWIGLYYNGLFLYDPNTGKGRIYTEKDGLPHSNVMGILEDNSHNLWISTENGLAVFNPDTNMFRTYTQSDGLAGNEFNYNSFLEDSRGEFFFGGDNGLTGFYPDKMGTNNYDANMVITGLNLFNQPVKINGKDGLLKEDISLTPEVVFHHNQDVFTLEFALLNYIRPGKNRYAYKLVGFDGSWNEVSNTAATYTSLPAGEYTFMVKGAGNDGIWSRPAVLKITVLPPLWLRWWSFLLYGAVITALLWLIFRFFYLRGMLKKEEELHQEKLNFFTNISHEIRTHLTLITAPVDRIMSSGAAGGFFWQQLHQVKDNADKLLRLVSELMDFRKAETGHLRLQPASHDVVAFLEAIVNHFRELATERNITISFNHHRDIIPLWFDSLQMEKVCFNLLSNAFKFTPDGGTIIVSAELRYDEVRISVTDNGRGIAAEYIDKLFDNFFQGDDHGQQNTGYGIGLALSRSIVELHKGTITVESRPASGNREGRTCFTVTIPRKSYMGDALVPLPEPVKVPKRNSAPVIAATETTAAPRLNTILLAEDNPDLGRLLRETFEPLYQVILCADGQEAWKTATEQIPDLVITDVMMPGMDGFMLCHELKTDERTSHIPVIMLTARNGQADQLHGLETGADHYLAKPFSPRALELNVRNLLALRENIRNVAGRRLASEGKEEAVSSVDDIHTAHDTLPNKMDQAFLQRAIGFVEEHMNDPEFGVNMLSVKLAMSPPVLYKKLKAVTDMSVNDFIKSLRMKKAAQLLKEKEMAVYEVAYSVGYNDRKYFSKEFKKQFGQTPQEIKNRECGIKKQSEDPGD
ncbi:two-component regulator propeller domain-containing protein [Chitinophaga sp. 212800010-3]|uniref:hybrid sensor histidine kinase/response regulator transcription factor n=1 Tax=unclassified Chitinophaga TaxID=2619133 RepID=UPI002E108095